MIASPRRNLSSLFLLLFGIVNYQIGHHEDNELCGHEFFELLKKGKPSHTNIAIFHIVQKEGEWVPKIKFFFIKANSGILSLVQGTFDMVSTDLRLLLLIFVATDV